MNARLSNTQTRRHTVARACFLGMAVAAATVTTSPALAGAELDELARINDALNAARELLPGVVGGSVEAEAEALARISEAAAQARGHLLERLRVEADAYGRVSANLTDLQAWLSHLELSHACNVARQEILTAHAAGSAAPEQIAALAASLQSFEAGARAEGRADVEHYGLQLAELQLADNTVAALAQAEETARAERERVAALERAAQESLAALERLHASLQPVTAEAMAPVEQAATALEQTRPELSRWLRDELVRYRLELHWREPSLTAEKAIAAELGGVIAAKSRTRARNLSLRVKARAGKCYVLSMHVDGYTGAETLEGFEWAAAGRPGLQEFRIPPPGGVGLPSRGFCSTRNATVTAKAGANLGRPAKSLRYLVVELERDRFPRALAARLELQPVDHCDAAAWKELWTQPVPGSFAYLDGEPILIRSLEADATVAYWSAGRPAAQRARAADIATQAPEAVVFRSALQPGGCPDDAELGRARAPLSRRIAQCRARVEKRFAAGWRKVERMRKLADRQGTPPEQAEALAKELGEQRGMEEEKRCGPIEQEAARAFEEAYSALVDQLSGRRFQDPADRAAMMRAGVELMAAVAAAAPPPGDAPAVSADVAPPPPPPPAAPEASAEAHGAPAPHLQAARVALPLVPAAEPGGGGVALASSMEPPTGFGGDSFVDSTTVPKLQPTAEAGVEAPAVGSATSAGAGAAAAEGEVAATDGATPAVPVAGQIEGEAASGTQPSAAPAAADAAGAEAGPDFIKGELIYPGTRRLLSRFDHVGVSIGADIVGSDLFLTLDPGMAWYFDSGVAMSLHVPLRLLAFQGSTLEYGGLKLRRRDWDQAADFAKVIRFLTYGRKEANIYFTINSMRPATIGHGLLLNRYQGDIDVDRTLTGLIFDAYNRYGGFELQLNDITFTNRIVGGLMFVKPLSLFSRGVYAEGVSLGVEAVADLRAPRCVRLSAASDECVPGTGGQTGSNPYGGASLDEGFVQTTVSAVGLSLEGKVYKDARNVDVKLYGTWHRFLNQGGGDGLASGVLARLNAGDSWVSAFRLRGEYRVFGDGFLPAYFDSLYEIQKYAFLHRSRDAQLAPTKYQAVFGDQAAGFARPDRGWRYGYNLEASWALFRGFRSGKQVAMGIGLSDSTGPDDTTVYLHLEAPALGWLQLFATYLRSSAVGWGRVMSAKALRAQNALLLAGFRLQLLPVLFVNAHYSRGFRTATIPGREEDIVDRLFDNVPALFVQVELGWEFEED